jgi:3-oxoacyl-[acyl-carrier protein] reductase
MAGAMTVTTGVESRLSGRRVLVLGGAGSIGAATCERLLAEGAHVVAADRNAESLAAVAGREAACGRLHTVVIDIAAAESIAAGVARSVGELGGLDAVVNATGISHQGVTLEEETLSGWEQVIAVNLTAAFALAKAVVPHLAAGSSVVFVSSGAAERGLPLNLAYGASKGGLRNFTMGLSAALAGRGIRVNSVGPGLMEFPMRNTASQVGLREGRTQDVPLGRLGRGADIAAAVAYLISDDAAWVTGQNFYVDGGSLAR